MSQRNHFFIGQQGHYLSRMPQNNYMNGHQGRIMGHRAMHPRFGFPENSIPYDVPPPRQSFGVRFHHHQHQPYFRQGQEKVRNCGGPRRRFPSPSGHLPMSRATNSPPSPFHQRYIDRPRSAGNMENCRGPEYVMRSYIGDPPPVHDYPRRVHRRYTEVSATVNFTLRSSSHSHEMLSPRDPMPSSIRLSRRAPLKVNHTCKPVEFGVGLTDLNANEIETFEANPMCRPVVAVGSDSTTSVTSSASNESFPDGANEDIDFGIETPPLEEEYEPENPGIKDPSTVLFESDLSSIHLMAVCDDEGFHEAFVGICIGRYPSVLGRQIEVAGYGVWFSDGSKRNFSGVLKPERPQNNKAVMIHGSARAVENMKKEGYSRIRINLENDYLNTNVLYWISKYMENSKAPPSNWDEVKYIVEILELCNAASGMVIKWSHCTSVSWKKPGIEKAKILARKAADAWIKEFRVRQEAVGTADYSSSLESENASKNEIQA